MIQLLAHQNILRVQYLSSVAARNATSRSSQNHRSLVVDSLGYPSPHTAWIYFTLANTIGVAACRHEIHTLILRYIYVHMGGSYTYNTIILAANPCIHASTTIARGHSRETNSSSLRQTFIGRKPLINDVTSHTQGLRMFSLPVLRVSL